ncbi:hybrid sensor histidine kinase/response regulator transcription factor [Bacteroides sp.]|uniref:hybrid sensor histidine kinase/response regulator transcription factor n=1 Tax=Bacteroides sp. TaxID=29523 RepID=UPI003A8FDB8E
MRNITIYGYLRILISGVLLCVLNLVPSFAFTNERFHHLTVKDGLAHTDVTCLMQDYTGLMWLGTNGGLQSYDGYKLTTYDYYKGKDGIRKLHNRITRMDIRDNFLWVGTESGLLKFDCNTHSYVPFEVEAGNGNLLEHLVTIVSVSPDDGRVWVKSNRALYVITTDVTPARCTEIKLAELQQGDEPGEVNSIVHYGQNTWVCTGRYLFQFRRNPDEIEHVAIFDRAKLGVRERVMDRMLIANNHLFLQTSGGLYRWKFLADNEIDRKSMRYVAFRELNEKVYGLAGNKFLIDKNGTYWGAHSSGLVEILAPFREPVLKLYRKEVIDVYSLSSEFISSFYIDRFNNLWIGTWGKGLNYRSINPSSFGLIVDNMGGSASLGDSFVTGLDKDPDGTLWILTQKGGLSHYDIEKGVLAHTGFPRLEINNRVFKKVLLDKADKNILYVGLIEGLIVYNRKNDKVRWVIGTNPAAEVNENINVSGLSFDSAGNLWVASWNKGLYVLNKHSGGYRLKYHLGTEKGAYGRILSRRISKIFYDEQKNEMFLCTNAGMNRLLLSEEGDIRKIIKYQTVERKLHSLSNNFIAAMDKQNDSVYWVGTLGGGLNRLLLKGIEDNAYEATVYDSSNGMSSNDIEIVLVDKEGCVWTGGNGIVKLDPVTGHTVKYDYIDGLQSNTFKFGSEYKGADGMMYMGGTEGLNYFYPYHVQTSVEDVNLLFTALDVHNHRIKVGQSYNGYVVLPKILDQMEQLTLHHDQNNFTLSYAVMGYQLSNRIMYRYRLKGFESAWREVSVKENRASYSNLDYGKYVFQLQASSDGGMTWSKQVKQLTITILPPWWMTATAKIIYLIVILAFIFILFYMYVHELKMKHQIYIRDMEKKKDEENHQMKLQFFMNISHEFKTPLTIILSAVEKLVTTDNVQQACYSSISRNANKLLTLITELVDFRKTDLGIMPLKLVSGDIGEYVENIVAEFQPWASKKGIVMKMEEIAHLSIRFDPEMVAKIIYNILSNSLKYTDGGGSVSVKVYRGDSGQVVPSFKYLHTEGLVQEGGEVCAIVVRDTGIGISQESISHIYDRFFQVESKTSSHLGSGIGLAVAKNMVLAHHGMIIVSSERNVGSEFIILLPLNLNAGMEDNRVIGFDKERYMLEQHLEYNYEELRQPDAAEDVEAQNQELPVLLIVEDNRELLLTLEAHFATSYEVLLAENGEEGLALCKEKYPDAVISDVMMPVMDGIQLCAAIRNDLSIAYTPVILLTAKSSVENQIEGYETGADLYLPKPFSMRILELNVARLIKHKRMMLAQPDSADTKQEEVTRELVLAGQDKVFLEHLNETVYENMSNPDLSVEFLCDKLGMGRTKLYATAKEVCGKPLGDYIRDTRLEHAAKLLRTTGMNITEIIYETGFGSNSHFSKIFKAKYGMTPTEYIKKGKAVE